MRGKRKRNQTSSRTVSPPISKAKQPDSESESEQEPIKLELQSKHKKPLKSARIAASQSTQQFRKTTDDSLEEVMPQKK